MKQKIKKKIKDIKWMYNFLLLTRAFIRSIPYRISAIVFSLCPVNKKKIVISSYYGKGYGDSSKYIVNELLKRNKNYDIVWLVNNIESDMPYGVRKVKYNSFSSFYEMFTAKIWIDNCRKPYYVKKKKGQFYIQTWHSSLRLKKIEKDVINELPCDYVKNAIADSKKIDLLTVGCEFSSVTYDRCFWYNGKKLHCGTPRCDIFFDVDYIKRLKESFEKKYNLENKKIILYAPTFRKDSDFSEINIDFDSFVSDLNVATNDEFVLFVKLHPISKKNIDETSLVIDFTNYSDIQELIAVCDYFITDYSGCCFDAMFAGKPCFLFTPDLNEYLLKERSLCFDFDELPFDKFMSQVDLVNAIVKFNVDKYNSNIRKFMNKIGSYENGEASKKICDLIDNIIEGDENEEI